MELKPLSELTDQELLQEAKKVRNHSILNAVLIGFLIGIVMFSAFKNTIGFLTLIPLYLAYKLSKKPGYSTKEIDELLKARNLK